jgi:hypothetical protein
MEKLRPMRKHQASLPSVCVKTCPTTFQCFNVTHATSATKQKSVASFMTFVAHENLIVPRIFECATNGATMQTHNVLLFYGHNPLWQAN